MDINEYKHANNMLACQTNGCAVYLFCVFIEEVLDVHKPTKRLDVKERALSMMTMSDCD